MGDPWDPPVIDVVLKKVASKNRAAASVISASPRPRRRSESSARMTATSGRQRRAEKSAQEQIEPEVVGQLGGGEGPHAGQAWPGTATAGPPSP